MSIKAYSSCIYLLINHRLHWQRRRYQLRSLAVRENIKAFYVTMRRIIIHWLVTGILFKISINLNIY